MCNSISTLKIFSMPHKQGNFKLKSDVKKGGKPPSILSFLTSACFDPFDVIRRYVLTLFDVFEVF